MVTWLFAGSIFWGAALLFQLEPFVGKSLLPWYGGTPAVWNTCVFFFQLLLLLGYLYAHVLHRWLSLHWQLAVHALVATVALVTLPSKLDVAGLIGSASSPLLALLVDLATSVGLVFFVVSTTSPLLQAWFAKARPQTSPYLLYVASNAGSLLGLLAYPTLVEFWLPLSTQSRLLTNSFIGLVALFVFCGIMTLRGERGRVVATSDGTTNAGIPVTAQARWNWFLWSLCPSSLLLGVTTYLSAEIAPMPAIWILPLSLYLLSFIIAFAEPPKWVMPLSVVGYAVLAIVTAVWGQHATHGELTGLVLHNGLLFCGALALHGRLSATRPKVEHLTEFYLWVSCGGVCGSIINTLIAPLVFDWLAEYPLAIGLGFCLMPWSGQASRSLRRVGLATRFALFVCVCISMSWNVYFSEASSNVVYRRRTFFGEFHVIRGQQGVTQQLVHGQTVHGMQMASSDKRERRPPLTYYFFTGPIGQVILANRGKSITQNVGVVGLGIGSLAAYAEAGDEYTFYEIDPEIARLAETPRYFTFLNDARERGAKLRVELGDARLRLRESPDRSFGLLVLDAFSSDAIPVHLLTQEALREYFAKLQPNGLLACHISNQYVNLEPILANFAAESGYSAYVQYDERLADEERRRGKNPSVWVVISSTKQALEPLLVNDRWRPCRPQPELGIWTDEKSNVLSVIRWKN